MKASIEIRELIVLEESKNKNDSFLSHFVK